MGASFTMAAGDLMRDVGEDDSAGDGDAAGGVLMNGLGPLRRPLLARVLV